MDFLLQCLGHRPNTTSAIQLEDGDTSRAADSLVDTVFLAEKNGIGLRQTLEGIIKTNSWRQNFAKAVFERMQQAIETARPMGDALREMYEKVACVVDGVEGFVKDHPIVCALIALGILVLLAPWVVEALGFAEGGILEGENYWCPRCSDSIVRVVLTCEAGSFAAEWQSTYAGFVPKGSLFSLLQRLGMKGFV
jgi:hypothetical protein